MPFLKNKKTKITAQERQKLLNEISSALSDDELVKLAKAVKIPFVKKLAVNKLSEFI